MKVIFEGTADEIALLLGSINSDILMSEVYGEAEQEEVVPVSVILPADKAVDLF